MGLADIAGCRRRTKDSCRAILVEKVTGAARSVESSGICAWNGTILRPMRNALLIALLELNTCYNPWSGKTCWTGSAFS